MSIVTWLDPQVSFLMYKFLSVSLSSLLKLGSPRSFLPPFSFSYVDVPVVVCSTCIFATGQRAAMSESEPFARGVFYPPRFLLSAMATAKIFCHLSPRIMPEVHHSANHCRFSSPLASPFPPVLVCICTPGPRIVCICVEGIWESTFIFIYVTMRRRRAAFSCFVPLATMSSFLPPSRASLPAYPAVHGILFLFVFFYLYPLLIPGCLSLNPHPPTTPDPPHIQTHP